MCTIPVFRNICRECYSEPEELYAALKARGMDLVTVTDHDSRDAAEVLGKYSDFFPSEEVTCRMPSGTEIHMGVFNLSEHQHIEIQRRRNDLEALLAYLNAFSALTGRRDATDYELFAAHFGAWETQNGHMPETSNQSAAELASALGKIQLGGSDAHSINSAGCAWTEVAGARTKGEFLAGLRLGHCRAAGENGSFLKLTHDVLAIARGLLREQPWTAVLMPLVAVIPFITAANRIDEVFFARQWRARLASHPRGVLAQA
jgi:hypothetical protein